MMDKTRLGSALKAAVLALNPNAAGMTGGEDAQLQAFMEAIANEVINEIKNHAQVDLIAADITVPALGLISGAPGAPVTGSAVNAAGTIAAGRIK